LPVPPFTIAGRKTASTRMFVSYNFEGDTSPDDMRPFPLYSRFKHECAGIVVFDILIANCDRGPRNLKVDNAAKPTAFHLIDHERALFYIYKGEGIKRLETRRGRLGITDSGESDDSHCLVEMLDDIDHIADWIARVHELPNWFIDDVCEAMWKVSLNREECDAAKRFLKERRDGIGKLVLDNRTRFPRIHPLKWPIFFGERK
jgi:hypothetical protein